MYEVQNEQRQELARLHQWVAAAASSAPTIDRSSFVATRRWWTGTSKLGLEPKQLLAYLGAVLPMPGGTEWHRYADFLTTIRTYVNAVSLLRQVEMVVLQGSTPDDARIWTVISAQPFDRMPRREVYEAQIEAQARAAEPLAEFRLLNVRELTIPLSSALPASYRVLYRS